MSNDDKSQTTERTPLQQAKEASDLARDAFASGDLVTGAAALVLAGQLIQLAKLWGQTS